MTSRSTLIAFTLMLALNVVYAWAAVAWLLHAATERGI